MTPGKFLIVRDHERYSEVEVLSSKDTYDEAVSFARSWVHSHPGKTCFVLERKRMIASDALREEA